MSKSILFPIRDSKLLVERCLYLQCYKSFHHCDTRQLFSDFTIGFPESPRLNLSQCRKIFFLLSIENPTRYLNELAIECLIYFAIFFQSNFQFERLHNRIFNNPIEIPKFLVGVLTQTGETVPELKPVFQVLLDEFGLSSEKCLSLLRSSNFKFTPVALGRYLRNSMRCFEHKKKLRHGICVLCKMSFTVKIGVQPRNVFSLPCCGMLIHYSCFELWQNYIPAHPCHYCEPIWNNRHPGTHNTNCIAKRKQIIGHMILKEQFWWVT